MAPEPHPFEPDSPCCVSCHLAWEEENVFPLLPAHVREQLEFAHACLRRLGFPPLVVEIHGQWELRLMREHCCPDLCATVEHDHVELAMMCPEHREFPGCIGAR